MKYLMNFNESKEESDKPIRSERLLTQAQKEPSEVNKQKIDNLPTILFTDIVGSAKMWSDDSITMIKQLKEHHELVAKLSEQNGGWIVKTIGDAFMVYFEKTSDSLLRALKFSKQLIENEKKYNLRIGVCQGLMQQETYRIQQVDLKDFFGNPVNTASRMESRVSGEAGVIAFTTEGDLSKKDIDSINKNISKVYKVNLEKYDLKGAKIDKAYKVKVK